jgi:putative SOS response-associated peptidase YedK
VGAAAVLGEGLEDRLQDDRRAGGDADREAGLPGPSEPNRCLVVADGFYEWTVGSDGKKQPIHFHLPGHELFTFAGLWTTRTDDETGEVIESCTIITTRPNELAAPVHDRMPAILPSGAESVWLDPTISKEHALSLLEPYAAELMVALHASTRVNSVRNDDSGLLLPDDALAA